MIRPVLKPSERHPISIAPHPARVIISRGHRVIVDTRAALRLKEASYPAVLYVPREDADLTLLEPSDPPECRRSVGASSRFASLVWR